MGSSCVCVVALSTVGVWLTICLRLCESTATLEVKIKRWESSCTDNAGLTSNCDPYFKFCLTKSDRNDCLYGVYECNDNNHYHDKTAIDFGSDICGIKNPMVNSEISKFDTNHIVKLTTQVWDADTLSDDHLITWSYEFRTETKKDSSSASFIDRYTYSGHHRLWFAYRVYCSPYYHTATCDVYCKAQDNASGHYTCDENTGGKICMPGWGGLNCDQDVNECLSSMCYNQGTCTNIQGSFYCACLDHYSGKNCDQVLSLCHSSPCQNEGICEGNLTSYNCSCNYMWEGPTCEQQVDTCQSNPCQHGGQCYKTLGNFSCSCPPGWSGHLCHLEVDACNSAPCHNEGTCSPLPAANYSCVCVVQYEGPRCETLKDPCSSNPCNNSATCEALSFDMYNCTCVFGWVGKNCSNYLDVSVGSQTATGPATSDSTGVNALAIGIGLGCALLLVLVLLLVLYLFRRRRQKEVKQRPSAGDDLHSIVPANTSQSQDTAFSNAMYDNSRNRVLEWNSTRPVPPTPNPSPDDAFYPGTQLKGEGAMAFASNPYAEADHVPNLSKKFQKEKRTEVGSVKCENHYADFGDIARRIVAPAAVAEENPYNDLDEATIGARRSTGLFIPKGHLGIHYDRPTAIDQVQAPPKLPNASHYDLPSTDLTAGNDARNTSSDIDFPWSFDLDRISDMDKASSELRCGLEAELALASSAVGNIVSSVHTKTISPYDLPIDSPTAADFASGNQQTTAPSPYDNPKPTMTLPISLSDTEGFSFLTGHPYDIPPSSGRVLRLPATVDGDGRKLYDVRGCTVTSSSDDTDGIPTGSDDAYTLVVHNGFNLKTGESAKAAAEDRDEMYDIGAT